MKLVYTFWAVIVFSSLSACSSFPIGNSPENSWRLQSFLDQGLSETIKVYSYCYKGKVSQYLPSREYKEGTHSVVARIVKYYLDVESKPRDAFVTLTGDFKNGQTYVFQTNQKEDKAELWIVNLETGEPVTEKVSVNLTMPDIVDNDLAQREKCEASTL